MPAKMTRTELLVQATLMAEQYRDDGYSLTLRQLYYALVSEGLIPNANESYKRLGDVLGAARLAGDFEMDLVVDRGRSAGGSKQHECKLDVKTALTDAGKYVAAIPHWAIEVDRWFGQATYLSVWVEKEALAGVFEPPCTDLGVGFFACKGYPSHSALWEWLQKCEQAIEARRWGFVVDDQGVRMEIEPIYEAVVLYFGDHDPDGWCIPRSAEETVNTFARIHSLNVPLIRFERVALNMDQITQYNPPPFPAKDTSSRYESYVREHGIQDAWELDALKPNVLDQLIRDEIDRYWDQSIYDNWQAHADANRARLRLQMAEPGWAAKILNVNLP